MRFCLVEDDLMLINAITRFCEIKKYELVTFCDSEQAFDAITINDEFDAYFLDLNFPGPIQGLDLLKRIRTFHSNVPIIIITAAIEFEPLEKAFMLGCSEYIKKPFNLKELDLRMKKCLDNRITKFNITKNLHFDFESKSLFFDNTEIDLRKKEKRAIEILIRNFNFIVTNENLQDFIWEGEIKESYPLRQLINTIRAKLPENFIKTEVGIGYKAFWLEQE